MAKSKWCYKCHEPVKMVDTVCENCGSESFLHQPPDGVSVPDQDEDSLSDLFQREDAGPSREGGFRVSTVSFPKGNFPVSTSNFIPGREIDSLVGVVFSSSNRRMGLTTTNLASNTFKDAYQDIQLKAKQMGADAVISLSVSIERAGPSAVSFSQTVTLVGTAVKLVK